MHAPSTLGAAALGLALLGAVADEAPSAAALRLATQEEYLACLVAQSEVEAGRSRLLEGDARHKARVAKFQAAERDLAAQARQHAPATQREVASYNRAVAARNASAESLNNSARSLQQEQAAFNQQVTETNDRCGGLLVSPEVARAAEEVHRQMRGGK